MDRGVEGLERREVDELKEGRGEEQQPEQFGEMTEEEANTLLDGMKDQEQRERERLKITLGVPVLVDRDW